MDSSGAMLGFSEDTALLTHKPRVEMIAINKMKSVMSLEVLQPRRLTAIVVLVIMVALLFLMSLGL
jgi:hypothetical protein